MKDKVTIKIPRTLYDILRKQIEGTGFNSVTDFIVYLLRDVAASGRVDKDIALTKEEISLIRKRLKALGYLE
ncbi:MAG: CopG family transcriptional regulator [Proteobacteria bacterium]|nr:CopG family transcriptional regulator [Pseudomonadota bacterium]